MRDECLIPPVHCPNSHVVNRSFPGAIIFQPISYCRREDRKQQLHLVRLLIPLVDEGIVPPNENSTASVRTRTGAGPEILVFSLFMVKKNK